MATVHLGGYFLSCHPIPRPYPGQYADGGNGVWMLFGGYLVLALVFAAISFWAVKRVDMLSSVEEEA